MNGISSNENSCVAFIGATLIDGTGKPPLHDSVIITDGNRIKQVGSRTQISVPENAEIVDLTGKTVTPGFIDSHCHYYLLTFMDKIINLTEIKSLQEALEAVKEKATTCKPGEWIHAYGWDESKWPENRYITTEDLDTVSPDNPVGLIRVDFHMIVFNSAAYKYMENTGNYFDSEDGQSSLNVIQNFLNYVDATMPDKSIEEFAEGLCSTAPYLFSHGCTGIHEPGLDSRGIRAYQIARRMGAPFPRAYVMVLGDAFESAVNLGLVSGFGDDFLQIGSAKFWIDGSLGSRSAALLEPYTDEEGNYGTLLLSGYSDGCYRAHSSLMQISTHAIGDRAVVEVLNTLESALNKKPRKDHRHRIEHCELLSSEQLQRLKDLGIVAAMQPNFVGAWCLLQQMYQQRIGEQRMRWCNPYRQLLDAGVVVAFGSDGMPFGPMFGIWGAVNHPVEENRISLVEAVKCYTFNCAYASFQEDKLGSIEAGKLADMAVLDGDLTKVPESDLHAVECYMTVLDGEIVYQKNP